MKQLMILGGILGFAIGAGFALAQSGDWPAVLWRASLAAYAAGLLLRWWGRIWIKNLRESLEQRQVEAANATESPATTNKR